MAIHGKAILTSTTSVLPIKTDGDCIDFLLQQTAKNWGEPAANSLRTGATHIVQKCVNTYASAFGHEDVGAGSPGKVSIQFKQGIAPSTNGLIYGKVQSGKTITAIATVALAIENGFRCFVFLTSDNVWLGRQTVHRFQHELYGGPRVYSWEDWRNDPSDFAKKLKDDLDDTGAVLITTKNSRHLDGLRTVLQRSTACGFPGLILDDEADNASLNTNEARQARNPATDPGAIFDNIREIREQIPNHLYLQITATPQSLLLQGLQHPCKPAFCELSSAGNGYIGGDVFFSENSPYCSQYDANELNPLKTGAIAVGKPPVPPGLKHALCTFFLGAAATMIRTQNRDESYSFLAHICHKKINQKLLKKVIENIVRTVDQALRRKLSSSKKAEEENALRKAYKELGKTDPNLPPIEELFRELHYSLRNAIPEVVNSDALESEPQYRSGMNILIGGNRLGRGVTIQGLMTTYYGRDAKTKMMDTVHQHARMFGYRQNLLSVTRLFLPQHILRVFRAIHEADEGMREAIGKDPSSDFRLQPVWVGQGLRPTRANVLNPAEIGAYAPGRAIFPPFPLYKRRDIEKHTLALDKILHPYQNDDAYVDVPIERLIQILEHMPSEYDGGTWEDERVREALRQMKSGTMNIQQGRLNVRRGVGGNGLGLAYQPDGFDNVYNSEWVNTAKRDHPQVPTLLALMQEGAKVTKRRDGGGWDDCRVYIPTLVLPNRPFVVMFSFPRV